MSFARRFIELLNGYRKWSIMFMIISLGVTFRITEHINGSELVDLLKGTVIAFFASNAGEHMTKAVIEWVKKK